MLFYALLFLFCIAISAVALGFSRSLYNIGKATNLAWFHSAQQNYRKEKTVTPSPGLNQAATPWGWKGGNHLPESTTSRVVGDVAQAAGSLKRSATNRKKADDPVVGWPYRDEKSEFAGPEYKVTHKKSVKKTNMGGVSKPWGW